MTIGFPEIRPAPQDRFEPFGLTDTQLAYVLGRHDVFDFGGVAAHGYYEYEGTVDVPRFTAAWQRLIERHDALRLVVDTDRREQRVLASVPEFEPVVHDLRALPDSERAQRLDELRAEYSHLVPEPGTWPLFHVAVSLLDDDTSRIHVGFDGLCFDYLSWRLLSAELTELYRDPAVSLPALTLTFRDYVTAMAEFESSPLYRRSEQYWAQRVSTFPTAPQLPAGDGDGTTRFQRREAGLAPERWRVLAQRARATGITPSVLMIAAFAQVAATWSGEDRFALNIPSMNRMPLHPDVESVVGEFASLCALEIEHDRTASFAAGAKRIQAKLWGDLEHSHYSALRFMRDLTRHDGGPERARMPIVLTSTLGWSDGARTPLDGNVREVFALSQTPQVSLDVQIHEHDDELYYNWDTVDSAFAPGVVDAMFDAFHTLLERLADSAELWHESDLGLVAPELAQVRGPERDLGDETVAQLFVEQARRAGDRPAVVAGTTTIGYGELLAAASRIANLLRERRRPGVDEPIVAIALQKGWQQFAAVYGVLLSGAAYLPIDTAQPVGRIEGILADAGADTVLIGADTPATVRACLGSLERIDVDGMAVAAADATVPDTVIDPHDPIYVLYTSGSTGEPKGVVVEHSGVTNCVRETIERFTIGPDDRALAVSALHHDMSGFDVFVALCAGATVVVPDADRRQDPGHWRDLVAAHEITVWCSVPAMLEMLDTASNEPLPTLRLALSGGDRITPGLVRKLRRRCPAVQFVSIGGPTETTLWNIWHPVDEPDPLFVPYGRPLANTRYLLADSAGRPVPPGVVGEMHCVGVGVARGYLHRPELNEQAFGRTVAGERLYRTGDFGRLLPNGTVEFVGRRDRQVKVRGHRIELAEVEAALAAFADAVAVTVADRHLVAHVVSHRTQDADEFRSAAADLLPAHMVPGTVRFLDALPLTPNGKVDYRTLGTSAGTRSGGYRAPATPLESALAQVWSEVLRVPEVGADDNFYSLGGDSVLAVELTKEMREVLGDNTIELQIVLGAPTLHALAHSLRDREAAPERLDEIAQLYLEVLALSDETVDTELADQFEH